MTIVGASKYEQKENQVAASASVITRDEIKTFGWRTLAEALSSLPGIPHHLRPPIQLLGHPGIWPARRLAYPKVEVSTQAPQSQLEGRLTWGKAFAALEREMRSALEHREFSLHYQPQFDAQSGGICGVEALIRWQHPVRGDVAPGEFIDAAEQSGLIIPIGQWVLATACAAAARWQTAGHPVRVAINLSPAQFKDTHLVQQVSDVLKATGLSPSLLELELTEGVVMQDTAATQQTLQAFQALGVQVALDDFGIGYSSLSYLKRMPLSCLKVDQSFVAGLPSDAQDRAIINAILAVAVGLGLRVIAGGIETQEQSQFLKQMGCHALQGYYFSRLVPTAEINVLLATSQTQAPSGLMAL